MIGAADVRCCKHCYFERRVVGEGEASLSGEIEGQFSDFLAYRAGCVQ